MGGRRLLQAHGTQPLGDKRELQELTPPGPPALPTHHQGPWLLAPAFSTSTRPGTPASMASESQRPSEEDQQQNQEPPGS